MIVKYVGHSGVIVELKNIVLMFDISDVDKLPELNPSKPTVVFVSHNHGDHYSEEIWNLRNKIKDIRYVISKDVHFSSGVRNRLNVSDEYANSVIRLRGYSNEIFSIACEKIQVQTIPSTDEGVAFLVRVEDKLIYHAGDHHLWLWEEEGQKYMDDMRVSFTEALSKLDISDDEIIDLAFLLLDPRLEDHAFDGLDEYLRLLPIRHVVPIHQWKDYGLTDRYIEHRNIKGTSQEKFNSTIIHKVTDIDCEITI